MTKFSWLRWLPLAFAVAASPGRAADSLNDVVARFAALENFNDASLSPDGLQVALVSTVPTGTTVVVAQIGKPTPPKAVLSMAAKDGHITHCRWISNLRLACRAWYVIEAGIGLETVTRMFAVNADASNLVQLSAKTSGRAHYTMQLGGSILDVMPNDKSGSVLMTRQFVPDTEIGWRTGSDAEGFGVELVDTNTLKRQTVETPRLNASAYLSDGHGTIRIMRQDFADSNGYLKGRSRYLYRKSGSREWLTLSETTDIANGMQSGFVPLALDRTKDVVFGFEDKNGYSALYSLSLDGKATRAEVLARPDTDVDGLIQIGPSARVVGATYATDRRTVEYFDPELSKLGAALSRALPGSPLVNIVDSTEDESKLLIIASSDTDPGLLYRYDKASHHLDELLPLRGKLEGQQLAPMKAITFKAADGTAIPAYLTLPVSGATKGVPAMVMPHGGPASRDEWGFDWLVQFYAARGFAVLQPNYRGSTGYGSEWYRNNGFQSWRQAMGDINDAGRWLISQGITTPDKLAIVGWSYGGYAAFQTAALDPDLFKAIVAIAPVTDLSMLKSEATAFTNAVLVARFIGEGPQVQEASPTRIAAQIKAPVLMFHGDRDQNVSVKESRVMTERLKAAHREVSYVEFPGLDHQLLDAAARAQLLSASDSFLRRALRLPQ